MDQIELFKRLLDIADIFSYLKPYGDVQIIYMRLLDK